MHPVCLCRHVIDLIVKNMANFRPVSNLSFMSTVVERAVANQLTCPPTTCYCASSQRIARDTQLKRVVSDVLMAADGREVTLLGMLDLSAAFDCVDHTILLQRLRIGCGVADVA